MNPSPPVYEANSLPITLIWPMRMNGPKVFVQQSMSNRLPPVMNFTSLVKSQVLSPLMCVNPRSRDHVRFLCKDRGLFPNEFHYL